MITTLSPDEPIVQEGKLLTFFMATADLSFQQKQVMVKKSFDYTTILEDIRSEGLIKTEHVYRRLYEVLLEREIVEVVELCLLDIGTLGRPSKAVQDHYRHSLNNNTSLIKRLKQELLRGHFTFNGPEGEIHLLSIDKGEVLGHVLVSLDDGAGLYADLTLDLVGPPSSDFPDSFEEKITERLNDYLQDNHPGLTIGINVRVRRSELALGIGHFLC